MLFAPDGIIYIPDPRRTTQNTKQRKKVSTESNNKHQPRLLEPKLYVIRRSRIDKLQHYILLHVAFKPTRKKFQLIHEVHYCDIMVDLCCSSYHHVDFLDVMVPADVMWQMIKQIDTYGPNVVQAVNHIEYLQPARSRRSDEEDGTKEFKVAVGARWCETRRHKGGEFVMYKTITELSERLHEEAVSNADWGGPSGDFAEERAKLVRTLRMGFEFVDPRPKEGKNRGMGLEDDVNSGSFRVLELDDNSCRLIISVATSLGNYTSCLLQLFCGPFFRRPTVQSCRAELEDYAQAAIKFHKSQQKQMEESSTHNSLELSP